MGKIVKKSKSAYHHGDLKQAMIHTAIQILEKEGMAGISIRNISKKVGVSHMAAYSHFSGKEELIAHIALEGFEELVRLGKYSLGLKNCKDAFLKFGEGYIDFGLDHPTHMKLMFSLNEEAYFKFEWLVTTAKESFDNLVECVIKCQKDKQFKKGDPREMAQSAWAMVHGLTLLGIDGQFCPEDGDYSQTRIITKKLLNNIITGLEVK
ncbi:MAG: TetR/AcrR family transcriptional regulator [Leptospira sp.]|nr:TetR/AcrR family transcriptional regulator [Leptospira sp.]